MIRLSVRPLVASAFACVLLAGCDGEARPGSEGADSGKTAGGAVGGSLIVAVPLDAKTLFPPAVNNSLDMQIVGSVFDRLADIGDSLGTSGDSAFVPQLARSWKWASDSLSIAFRLDSTARWHDGQPVRAEDVRFTYTVYANPASGSVNPDYVSNIDSVSIADSLTPVVWFKRRSPHQFFEATYIMYVLPAHLLRQVPTSELGSNAFARNPIGSGRFRFREWIPQQRIEIVSDTGNYRGRAKLDRVVWAISGEISAATLSLFTGTADFYEKLSVSDLDKAMHTPNLQIKPYSQIGYTFLSFNFRSRTDSTKPHPIFDDVRVRQAFSMAVDRARLAQIVLDSFARVSIGPSPRLLFPNADALKPLPFNRAVAQALLDSAGWVLAPGQTVRSKHGLPLAFEVYVQASSETRQTYARLLEQQFKAIGAALTIRVLEGKVLGPLMEAHDFDTYLGAWTVTPGLLALPQTWGSRGGGNFGSYSNVRFDATVDSALNAFKPSVKAPLMARAFQQIIDDAPAIWLYEETEIGVMHRRVRPTFLRPDAWYAGLADWTIDPAQRIDRDRIGLRGDR